MKNPFANLFKKKDTAAPEISPLAGDKSKKESFFSKLLKNRLGKSSVKGEEILGVDLSATEIRLAQISSNKANQWILDKFYVHKIEGLPENATVLEHPDKIAEELNTISGFTVTNTDYLIQISKQV